MCGRGKRRKTAWRETRVGQSRVAAVRVARPSPAHGTRALSSTRDEKRRRLFFRRSATLARSLGSVVAARGLERLRRVTTAKGPGINLPSLVALGLGALPRALRVCLCRSASSAARSSSRSRAENRTRDEHEPTRQNLNSRVSGSPNRVGLAEAVDGIRFSSHVWAV